jgi:hypothetical protein
MTDGPRVIRLFLVGSRTADRERAELIVDRLAATRPITGGAEEWRVMYPVTDASEAMAMCEADLSGLEPAWLEILDFEALPSRPILRSNRLSRG